MKHRYNWIPDLPDIRDHTYAVSRTAAAVRPQKVDLRKFCSPIEDQGDIGSCTGNAIVGALEFLEWKAGKHVDLSRLWVYYQERVIERDVRQDSGAMIRDGVKSCAKLGVCTEALWPYDTGKFAKKPPLVAYTDAGNRKIREYVRVVDLPSMLARLAEGFPVVFGFTVYESFESDSVARTGFVNLPGQNEAMLGGHAVLAVGYDDKMQRVTARNSWGPKWGMAGYFTLPYAYLNNRNLSDDFWTIRK